MGNKSVDLKHERQDEGRRIVQPTRQIETPGDGE